MLRVHRCAAFLRTTLRVALALGALLALAAPGHADVVHLAGGTELNGKVVEETDEKVVIRLRSGTMSIPRSRVTGITRSADDDPAAAPPSATGSQGPTAAERRRQHELDQRARVGPRARTIRTAHWTLVTDVSRAQERELAEVLEATWRRFHQETYRLGLRPHSISDRLECLYFADEERYDGALRADGLDPEQVGVAQVAGRDQLLVVHEGSRSAWLAQQIDVLSAEIGQVREERDRAARGKPGEGAQTAEQYEARIEALHAARATYEERHRRAALGLEVREVSRSAAAQIAFAKGVLGGEEPRWLWDGLLATLELTSVDDAGRTGPHPLHLPALQQAWEQGHHTRLLDIVEGEPRSDVELGRAEAWSLVRYLARRHTRAFSKHVRTRTSVVPESGLVQDSLEHLRRDLGVKLSGVDAGWRKFVRDGAR